MEILGECAIRSVFPAGLGRWEGRNMWILFAFGSALFAGLTSILAKIGVQSTDSNLATALRTMVVLLFSWLMVFLVGSSTP